MSLMAHRVVTLSRIGYVPASGTVATLLTMPIIFFIWYAELDYAFILAATTLLSFIIVQRSLPWFERKDPREIVLEEVVGCLFTFYGIVLSGKTLLVGFILFRFFDIFKPSFIGRSERLPGVWGIMTDDIAAGICANIIMRIMC